MFDCGITMDIKKVSDNMITQINNDTETYIVTAVQEVGIKINKEQLTQALTHSESFYKQGYDDGYDKGYHKAFMDMIGNLRAIYIAYFGSDAAKNLDEDEQNETC